MKNRKPLLASLLAAAMLITSAPLGILAPASAAEVQNDYELTYSSNGDGTCTLTGYTGTPVDVDIPETSPDGDKVTAIGEEAFAGCSNLTDIIIPEGVTSIGDSAFVGCSSLKNITIPEGVASIGDYVFSGCYMLTNITIPEGVTSIGDSAFYASSLRNIIIPESVTSIGDYAFGNNECLIKITIFEGITSIGDGAFEACLNLTNITIPEGVTSIGGWAFNDCICLTNITIPESVAEIGRSAFSGCSSLTEVTILSPLTTFNTAYNSQVFPTSTTIHGYSGSTAEAYASEYAGNPFVPLDETNKFSTPEVTQDQAEDGTPVNAIAVEEGKLAAYANNRAHEDGSFDLRIILAENAVIQNGEKLTLSVYRDGSPEAYIISRTVADEYVAGKTAKTYGQVIAAGETYAAGGSGTLFGFVVTGIPAGGFDSATLTVTAADGSVIAATQFAYATVAPQA